MNIRATAIAKTLFPQTVAAALMLVATTSMAMACDSGDDEKTPATPTAVTPGITLTPSATASATPATTPNPLPTSVSDITRVSIPKGGSVTDGWGLVLGNKLTGGVEVWLMPGGTTASGISPSGRYFVWDDSIFDGWTGTRTKINDRDDAIVLASFAPDDSAIYVQNAGNDGRVLRLDGGLVAELPAVVAPAKSNASRSAVVWSTDSLGVAITRSAGTRERVDAVIDGVVYAAIPSTGLASWSTEGHMLAVTGENPAIYDFDNHATLPLVRSGQLPAWSGDDHYLAVDISEAHQPALSVVDATEGNELYRIYNASGCFDLSWHGDDLPVGYSGLAVRAPSGEIVQVLETVASNPFQFPKLSYDESRVSWSDATGTYATVTIHALYAASFSWLRRDIDDFPPVIGLGLGGKDMCIGQSPPPVVVFPPFTPDKIPTTVPTPTH
ncbi:MAG: hypothetical protein AB7N24_06770 [Dehalococcoidia bacterium]